MVVNGLMAKTEDERVSQLQDAHQHHQNHNHNNPNNDHQSNHRDQQQQKQKDLLEQYGDLETNHFSNHYFCLTSLWEINARFDHFRSQNYAQYIRTSSSLPYLPQDVEHKKPTSTTTTTSDHHKAKPTSASCFHLDNGILQSAPTSPRAELNINNGHHPVGAEHVEFKKLVKTPTGTNGIKQAYERHFIKNERVTSNIGKVVKKIHRSKRNLAKTWFGSGGGSSGDTNASKVPKPRCKSLDKESLDISLPSSCKDQRSLSESRIEEVPRRNYCLETRLKSESLGLLTTYVLDGRSKSADAATSVQLKMDKSKDHHNHHHHHQSSRLIQPPNSLELANSNVVTEHQTNGGLRRGSRETNGKESMNSIGTCSIDIDCTNYANNRKNYVYTSISEKSIGSLNKYGSSEFDTNTSGCLNGSSSRLPSYVGISCAISGYSSYSRFCASTRNSHSHGNSPTCRYFDSDEGGNKLGINDDGLSSRASIIKSAFSTGRAASAGLTLESQALSTKTESQADEIDGDGSSLKEKSLLQQKIESLYGKSFATGWRDSRLRHRPGRPDLTIVQRRSPSCPPKMVEAKVDVNDKETRPVFRHVTKAFLEQLETKSNKSGESSRAASATKKSNEQLTNRRPSITVPNTEISQINGTSPKAANYESISSISSTENKEGGNIAPSKINGTKCEEGTSSTMEPSPATVTPTDPPVTGPGATTATERKDGNWFLKELNSTCEDIKKMVDEVNQCIEVDSSRLTEELNGKLLSFVGKANLLLSQKLNQFRELTLKNINQKPEDEYPTKIEDLEGFWEMVLIQINEIKNIFVEILMLKANNWEISCGIKNVNEEEPKTIRSPGKRKKDPGTIPKMPARTGAGTVKLEKISAAREEARKNRRREARRLQAAKQQAEGEASTDILLFVPSDKMQSPKMTEEEKEKASKGRSYTEQEEAITTVEAEIVSVGDKQLETTGDGTRKDDEDQGLEYSEV